MPLQLSLARVLSAFKNTYNSIDGRIAAVLRGDQWVNVLSIYKFSHESEDTVRDRHGRLRNIFGEIDGNILRFQFVAESFSKCEEVVRDIQGDTLKIFGDRLFIGELEPLDSQFASIARGSIGIRDAEGFEWPNYRVGIGTFHADYIQSYELMGEANLRGASRAEDILNALFEAQLFGSTYPERSIYFHAPIYIRIADASIDHHGFHVSIDHHPNILSEPKALLVRNDGGRFTPTESISIERKSSELLPPSAVFVRTRYEGRRPTGIGTWIQIGIADKTVGEIETDTKPITGLLPIEEKNPLYAALRRFCSEEELKQCLLNCHEKRPAKLKTSSAFELHVSWLLSLVGLSPIILGQYEKLFAVNTDFRHASIDILAENPATHTIFVIDCSLVVPPSEDYSKVLTAKSVLKNEIFMDSTHVQAMLFTGASDVAKPNHLGQTPDVVVIDALRMEQILAFISSGQQSRVLAYFENPAWPPF